jgi:hypothetical protein
MPIAYPTEAMAFYINTPLGANYGTFSDMRLSMVRADNGAVVSANIATLSQHMLAGSNYNFYATIVIPAGATTGIHYFRIYKASDGSEVLRSNYVLVRTDKTNLDNQSIFCRFRHDRFHYNIKYHELIGFYQQFRIPMSIIEEQYESEVEAYKEVTTGKPRILNSYDERFYKLEGYYLDPAAHEAAFIMTKHDYLEMNGLRYRYKAGYKILTDNRSKVNKAEFEVYSESFANVNRC